MGLFSSITEKISKITLAPSAAIGNLITSGLEKVTGKTYGRTTSTQLSKTTAGKVLGTAIGVTAAAIPIAAAPAASLAATKSVAKFVAPKTPKAAIASAIAVPAAIGVLKSSPTARSVVSSTINPLENIKRGEQLGSILEKSPSKTTIAEVATKGALIGGGAALAAGAVAIAPKVLEKAKELLPGTTGKAKTLEDVPITITDESGKVLYENKPAALPESVPKTTPGQITKTPTKRRKRKKVQPIKVSQKVNVNVRQSQNRKFINAYNYVRR